MENQVLSSYDDIQSPNWAEYAYQKVFGWIASCKDLRQLQAAKNAYELFKKKYPKERYLCQELYRRFWQLQREFKPLL